MVVCKHIFNQELFTLEVDYDCGRGHGRDKGLLSLVLFP
jgi:hypothetical protein